MCHNAPCKWPLPLAILGGDGNCRTIATQNGFDIHCATYMAHCGGSNAYQTATPIAMLYYSDLFLSNLITLITPLIMSSATANSSTACVAQDEAYLFNCYAVGGLSALGPKIGISYLDFGNSLGCLSSQAII